MRQSESGFSLIELLATIVVSVIFLVSAYQLVGAITSLSVTASQVSIADDLAYANMRQYANGNSPIWFTCDPVNPTTFVTLLSSSSAVNRLPSPVSQVVRANAPYGCSGTASGMPIYVESYVTFGPNSRKVIHGTYVTY